MSARGLDAVFHPSRLFKRAFLGLDARPEQFVPLVDLDWRANLITIHGLICNGKELCVSLLLPRHRLPTNYGYQFGELHRENARSPRPIETHLAEQRYQSHIRRVGSQPGETDSLPKLSVVFLHYSSR